MGYPAIYIVGNQEMNKRIGSIEKLKKFKCRILFTTDLIARGIDAENVNLIINIDIPGDGATYLHRIGRAGRYGSRGISISIISENELSTFQNLLLSVGGTSFSLMKLPEVVPETIWNDDENSFDRIQATQPTVVEDNTELEKNIMESEHGVAMQPGDKKIDTKGTSEKTKNKKAKKAVKSLTGKLSKAIESLKVDCIRDRSNTVLSSHSMLNQNIKYLQTSKSTDPSGLEKFNEKNRFALNLKKIPQNELSESEFQSVQNYLTINFVEKSRVEKSFPDINTIDSTHLPMCHVTDIEERIENSKRQFNSELFDTKDFQNLLEAEKNVISSSNNLNDTEEHILHEASHWKRKLMHEMMMLEMFLPDDVHTIEYTRNFYVALHHFYDIQKKALLCIYPEIRNEVEIKDTYLFCENNQGISLLKMYQEIEDFKSLHRSQKTRFSAHFPYPTDTSNSLPNLMITEHEIKKYRAALDYLRCNCINYDAWIRIRYILATLDSETKEKLVEKLKNSQKPDETELLSIISEMKTENSLEFSDSESGSDDFSSEIHYTESERCKIKEENKNSKYIPLVAKEYPNSNQRKDVPNCSSRVCNGRAAEILNVNNTDSSSDSSSDDSDSEDNYEPDQAAKNVEETNPISSGYSNQSWVNSNYFSCEPAMTTYNTRNEQFYHRDTDYIVQSSQNDELEAYFRNIRLQTDQIHLQEYLYQMLNSE